MVIRFNSIVLYDFTITKMNSMLFCAAATLSAIFNIVEAGIIRSAKAATEDWVINMGEVWADSNTKGKVCAGAGLKPQPGYAYIQVVTTAQCARIVEDTQLAKIAGVGVQPYRVIVYDGYTSDTPHLDIAVVLIRVSDVKVSTDNWPQIPEPPAAPADMTQPTVPSPAGDGYKIAFWYSGMTTKHDSYKQKQRDAMVVSNAACNIPVEQDAVFLCVKHSKSVASWIPFYRDAPSGTPLYKRNHDGTPALIGLHQFTLREDYHQFISVDHFKKWIQQHRLPYTPRLDRTGQIDVSRDYRIHA